MAPATGSDTLKAPRRPHLSTSHRVLLPRVRPVPFEARERERSSGLRVVGPNERHLRFQTLPEAVGAARRALSDWESELEPTLFYDLSLCVSELVTNSVHRRAGTDSEEASLAVRRSATVARAELTEPSRDEAVHGPLAGGGEWGIFIIDHIADRWGVDTSSGTRLWCEMDLAADGRSRRRPLVSARP